MSPEQRQQQIEEVFQTAALMDEERRQAFLSEACADESIREEVEKLLTGGGETRKSKEDLELDRMIGREVGAYKIEKEIGRGGMGAVYLARRADGAFEQKVAIKLIKRGMDTDLVVRRFRNERQILATLNHPNITRLLDGGTTEDGLPYFVMEYIEGRPLYVFCDENKLSVAERLRIFRQICDAIEEAHRHKIIHRDLKPSNILVKADGTPKLLDFGIAKLLDPEMGATEMEPTATHLRMMTPQYASPEQISGESVTPASDIYSLGVLLYELLTGHRPYRVKSRAPYEIARAVREEDPPRPSESLSREDNFARSDTAAGEKPTLEMIFDARGASLEILRKQLAGDLDKIVLKTLRKNPAERYQSAADLSEDLENFLENRPVKAGSFVLPKSAAAKKPAENSIAILPFKLLGSASRGDDTGDNYLRVGLADALISRLSRVRRLLVRPTSSILRFQDATDIFAAGRELDATFVVEGTIRSAGERIRVSVRLLSVRDKSTVWSGNFDEPLADVLEIEDSISSRVAETLLSHLTGEEEMRLRRRGTNSPAAHEAYLRGRHYANEFKADSLLKAVEAYREAVRLDPDFALPHVGIADFYVLSAIIGVMPPRDAYPKAKEELRLALQADDALAEAYSLLAFIALLYDWDWPKAERLVARALELNPNYHLAHDVKAHILASQGVAEEAAREIKISESLDLLAPRAKLMTSCILYQTRHFDEGARKAAEALQMEADSPIALVHYGNSLTHGGNAEKAVEVLRRSARLWETSAIPKYMLCFALVAEKQKEAAREVLDEILAAAQTQYVKPYFAAMACVALGETDAAFEWFEKGIEARDDWLLWFGTDIKLDSLRRDPRYFEILRKTNNPILNRQASLAGSPTTTGSREKSIAVLPLKMLGTPNADDEYLAVGLADAMITRLSNVRRLIVRPTSSVLRFGEREDLFAAGRELGVDFVLSGTLRRFGERLRISAQLLDIKTNATRWAQNYDEKSSDILELEDTVSEQVTKSLIPQLTGEEERQLQKRGTNNVDAFEAYLRGRFYWNLQTEESFAKAIAFFERAVELDPNYALAYAAIADYYIYLGIHCVLPFAESTRLARTAALKAVELDETSAEAQTALGIIAINRDFDWHGGEEYMRRAIRLNPNIVSAHRWYNALLLQSGRFEEAMEQARKIIELDPDSILSLHFMAWTLYHRRELERSIEVYRRMLSGEPLYAWGHLTFSWTLRCAGRFDEALAAARKAVELAPNNPMYHAGLAAAEAAAGKREAARKTLAEIEKMSVAKYVSPFMQATVYCQLDDFDRTFAELERAYDERDVWVVWTGVDPQFERLQDNSRFQALLRRMNHPLAERKIEKAGLPALAKLEEKSIAVLPLKVLGLSNTGDSGEEFLGIGLTDALITRLSKVRRFLLRPTSSVLQYADAPTDPFAAGRELNVDFVLDGNVRRGGERIRVSVQLLSVSDNATLWAESFDEKSSDVLELEDSISEKVVQSLIPRLTGEERRELEKRGTNLPAAFEAYMRGRFHWNQFTPDALLKAQTAFQQAIELDPDYALAHVGLADFYIWANIYGLIPSGEATPLAEASARRAIRLDENLGEAYASLGLTNQNRCRWTESERLYRRAMWLAPNYVHPHEWWAAQLVGHRHFEEGLKEIKIAERLDPLSLRTKTMVAWTLYQMRRYEEALEVGRQIVDLDKNYPQGYAQIGNNLLQIGRADESVANYQKFDRMIPDLALAKYPLCHALVAAGREPEARRVYEEIRTLAARGYVKPYFLGMAQVALGELDAAFENFEKAAAENDPWMLWFGTEPLLDAIRADKRYLALMRRMNLPLPDSK